jgi:hypothetical protein
MWQVRDIVGHLIDVTEGHFTGFDAAGSGAAVPQPLGLRVMAEGLDAGARVNAGTIRGDRKVADAFLNSFFRI